MFHAWHLRAWMDHFGVQMLLNALAPLIIYVEDPWENMIQKRPKNANPLATIDDNKHEILNLTNTHWRPTTKHLPSVLPTSCACVYPLFVLTKNHSPIL